jgi:SPP1 family predicted phage head-tail adaptor
LSQNVRVKAGALRHAITILQPSLVQDAAGGWQIGADNTFAANVPAEISTLTGRELEAAKQKVSEVTHKITIRWQPGILASMNVGWFDDRPRFFQIQAVENPDGRRIKLELLCIERDDSTRNV